MEFLRFAQDQDDRCQFLQYMSYSNSDYMYLSWPFDLLGWWWRYRWVPRWWRWNKMKPVCSGNNATPPHFRDYPFFRPNHFHVIMIVVVMIVVQHFVSRTFVFFFISCPINHPMTPSDLSVDHLEGLDTSGQQKLKPAPARPAKAVISAYTLMHHY